MTGNGGGGGVNASWSMNVILHKRSNGAETSPGRRRRRRRGRRVVLAAREQLRHVSRARPVHRAAPLHQIRRRELHGGCEVLQRRESYRTLVLVVVAVEPFVGGRRG